MREHREEKTVQDFATQAQGMEKHSGASSKKEYSRHDPSETLLYQVIQNHWNEFLALAEENERTIPTYVKKEFEAFLECGILACGFTRWKCEDCPHEKILAFSCKKRGFCPSCTGRRMCESGIFLSEQLFPEVPLRQWVITFPIQLRYWMASRPVLMSSVCAIINRAINRYYLDQAKKRKIKNSKPGSLFVVQRFGSSVNLNLHLHGLWMEGVHVENTQDPEGRAPFYDLPPPSDEDVKSVLFQIRNRVVRHLIRKKILKSEEELGEEEDAFAQEQLLLSQLMTASVQNRIATGEHAGERVRRIGSFGIAGEKAEFAGPRCATLGGFSLHANVGVSGENKEAREKLCRYLTRPPIAGERLFLTESDEVAYTLKKPWSDGTQAVVFTKLELIEKIIGLIPPPRIHMIKYYGSIARHSKMRKQVVPISEEEILNSHPTVEDESFEKLTCPTQMSWSALLKRVFEIDIQKCPHCGGKLKWIATICKRKVIIQILDHLKLSYQVPVFRPASFAPS